MRRRPKLGYIVSHPIQYQAPLFRRLAASDRIDFVAMFGSDYGLSPSFDPQFGRVVDFGVDKLSGYRSVFIKQAVQTPSIDSFFGLRAFSADEFWGAENPSVVILHGWRTAMMWQAAIGAAQRHVPYLMRAETPEYISQSNQGGFKKMIRDIAVGALVRNASCALALGAANERFYLRMGCRPGRIFRAPYFVDNDEVAVCAERGRRQREQIRADLGIDKNAFAVVGVAKLMKRKRPLDLVRALPFLPKEICLVWVGSGELENAVRSEAVSLGVADRVHLTGFRPSPETWSILGACDLFALPSESEPWGLAINEAVAAQLPALVTDQCGAAEDLIVPDATGEILPTGDLSAWVAAIKKWFEKSRSGEKGNLSEMKRRAGMHSVERAALAIENAVVAVAAYDGVTL